MMIPASPSWNKKNKMISSEEGLGASFKARETIFRSVITSRDTAFNQWESRLDTEVPNQQDKCEAQVSWT